MAEYTEMKKVWDWMNTIGFELEDDGLLDVEPFADHNMGDLADLMIDYSNHVLTQAKEKE